MEQGCQFLWSSVEEGLMIGRPSYGQERPRKRADHIIFEFKKTKIVKIEYVNVYVYHFELKNVTFILSIFINFIVYD